MLFLGFRFESFFCPLFEGCYKHGLELAAPIPFGAVIDDGSKLWKAPLIEKLERLDLVLLIFVPAH